MTKELAIRVLTGDVLGTTEQTQEAVKIAVEALSEPSAQPYTEDEIQKIQDLEQAQLDKMYELGKQTAQAEIIHCRECKHHIDGFFCQKANHHTSDTECCASVFGAERMEE